jgi:ubiquinone/menaquinone biosynthesis C-methylase UbiE
MVTQEVKASGGTSWSTRAREFVRFSTLLLSPGRGRADLLYELASTDNYLTEKTLYRNVGYWKNAPATLDDACQELARLAAETLQLGPQDRLLDVGFGYGDQDMFWAETFKPREIVGINITHSQLETASERVAARGMSDRVKFQLASSTAMPFETGSFDKMVALESAFHFRTREDFFREAFRVLRPGGRLVTLDIVPHPYQNLALWARWVSSMGLHLWQTCEENVYPREVYEQKLRAVGFNAKVDSVFEDTLVPFAHYMLAGLDKPVNGRKINSVVSTMLSMPAKAILDKNSGLMTIDYVLAVADKPV